MTDPKQPEVTVTVDVNVTSDTAVGGITHGYDDCTPGEAAPATRRIEPYDAPEPWGCELVQAGLLRSDDPCPFVGVAGFWTCEPCRHLLVGDRLWFSPATPTTEKEK